MKRVREISRILSVYARRAQHGLDRRYTLFEPAHLFQAQSLERALLLALRREGFGSLAGLRILEVGCGGGSWLSGLARYGAEPSLLCGIDLGHAALPRSTAAINVATASADSLPFASGRFDIVCQLTMMSSVLDPGMRRTIVSEMLRVLRPGGILLWYDFTVNPFNRDVAGIRHAELCGLFQGAVVRASRVTVAPPLTRLLAPRAWLACEILEAVPWLRTHLFATVRRPESPRGETPRNSD